MYSVRLHVAWMAIAVGLAFAGQAVATPPSWSIQTAPAPADTGFWGVSCPTTSSCVAVGFSLDGAGSELPVAEHWDGQSWAPDNPAVPAGSTQTELQSVSCTSASDCVAVGSAGGPTTGLHALAEHWDGASWSLQSPATPALSTFGVLYGVSCVSASDCSAVGAAKRSDGCWCPLAEHWNGSAWREDTVAEASEGEPESQIALNGVSCSDPSRCTAVGQVSSDIEFGPLAERWNGTAWVQQPTDQFAQASDLQGVSCPSASACLAVGVWNDLSDRGDPRRPAVERWDGTRWTAEQTPADGYRGGLEGVSCASTTVCVAVGGNPLVERWTSDAGWKVQSVPVPAGAADYPQLRGVSCPKPNLCTAVGEYSTGADSFPLVERYS